mgnify:CR=1 FL=1
MTHPPVTHRAAATDTLVLPHAPWKGKLDWKLLLGWLGGKPAGDIHYRFLIDMPAELTDEQSELVEKLSQTMNGTDPRAALFANAAPTGGSS